MSMRLVPAGATIDRVYYAIPTYYTIGDEFETWNEAVTEAKRRYAEVLAQLTASMGGYATPEEIERTAKTNVNVDLRWHIRYPDGGGMDTMIERHKDVTVLRTSDEAGTLAPR